MATCAEADILRAREALSTEDHANVPVIPPVLFGVGLAAGFFLKWLVPVRLVPPSLQEPFCFAGAGLALLGLAFGGWAFATSAIPTTPAERPTYIGLRETR